MEKEREDKIAHLENLKKESDLHMKLATGSGGLLAVCLLLSTVILVRERREKAAIAQNLQLRIGKHRELLESHQYITLDGLYDGYLRMFPGDNEIISAHKRFLNITHNDPEKAEEAVRKVQVIYERMQGPHLQGQSTLNQDDKEFLKKHLPDHAELQNLWEIILRHEEQLAREKILKPRLEELHRLSDNGKLEAAGKSLVELQQQLPDNSELASLVGEIDKKKQRALKLVDEARGALCLGLVKQAERLLESVLELCGDNETALEFRDSIRSGRGRTRFILVPLSGTGPLTIICKSEAIIGREDEGSLPDISFDNRKVSRNNVKLTLMDDCVVAEDQNSTCGSFVNGEKITSRRLRDGDTLSLAKQEINITMNISVKDGRVGGLIMNEKSGTHILLCSYAGLKLEGGVFKTGNGNTTLYNSDGICIISTGEKPVILKSGAEVALEGMLYRVEAST